MRFLVILFLFSSCGTSRECAGFYVEGVCVVPHIYPIEQEMIKETVKYTENAVSRFYDTVSVKEKANETELIAHYVEKVGICETCMGVYYPVSWEIEVEASLEPNTPDEMFRECVARYYIFGHELMHFISHEITNKDEDDVYELNKTHVIPNMFLQWCIAEKIHRSHCAEAWMIIDVRNMCAKSVGIDLAR